MTQLSKKAFYSLLIREALHQGCSELPKPIAPVSLIRSVSTRWNSVSNMLMRGIKLKTILDDVCNRTEFNKSGGPRLRRFKFDKTEWTILEQLAPILDVSSTAFNGVYITNVNY